MDARILAAICASGTGFILSYAAYLSYRRNRQNIAIFRLASAIWFWGYAVSLLAIVTHANVITIFSNPWVIFGRNLGMFVSAILCIVEWRNTPIQEDNHVSR
jgi:hypothetical protein